MDLTDEWHHFVGTWKDGYAELYVDGVARNTGNTVGGNINDSRIIRIGQSNTGSFDGIIDEVRIYNRALSEREIKTSYQKGINKHQEIGGSWVSRNDVYTESGNIGIGTSEIKENNSLYDSVTFPTAGIMWRKVDDAMIMTSNAYLGPDWKYMINSTAASISLFHGNISLNTAPSGTADASLSWNKGIYLNNASNVGIGTSDPNYKLDVRGTIGNNTTIYHSDIRWKDNVQTIDTPLNKIQNIRGISFKWKKAEYPEMGFDDDRHYGFIAQEVEQIIPDLVRTNNDGYKAIEYTNMVAILVEAMKEQQTQIETLENLIETQQQQIDQLKTLIQKEK